MAPADLLFRHGNVFDGARHLPGFAVAVADGRVLAVLPEDDADDLVGPATRVVDLAGGLVLPGFQDAHVHPVQGGLERSGATCPSSAPPRSTSAPSPNTPRANPDRAWVTGGGWSMPAFGPTGPRAADLDAVVADRPVLLPNRDHHGAWVNSVALRLAGIDRLTPDPADGRIERDERGEPTGTLHEGAMALVSRHMPSPTQADYDAGLEEGQAYLHSLGVTAWQDAILGAHAGFDDATPAYLRAQESGRLTARVRGAMWWERDRGLEQVPELLLRRELTHRDAWTSAASR